jgi:hypothetical protein
LLQKTDGGDLFQVNNDTGSDDHIGGVTFRDLLIDYATVQTSGAAIHVVNGQNVRIFRCVFQNCPQGVWFDESLQSCMIDCTATYPAIDGTQVAGTALILGHPTSDNSAIETFVAGCVFDAKTSPAGSVGILLNNIEHARITTTRVNAFNQGIVVAPGGNLHNVRHAFFINVTVLSGSSSASVGQGVLIQPQNGTWVGEVTFAECELDAPDSGTSYQGGGVVIDPVNGSGGGGVIDQVRFVDCHVCLWSGPGLLILGGSSTTQTPTNIEIVGGYFSVNGSPLQVFPRRGSRSSEALTGLPGFASPVLPATTHFTTVPALPEAVSCRRHRITESRLRVRKTSSFGLAT